MTRRSTRFWPASRVSSTTRKAIFAIEASPMPLLWHRRLSTPVRETLLLPGRDRGALDQQLPTLAHQGLGDTLSSAPTLACEQQCRGLALQLTNRSLRCLFKRSRASAWAISRALYRQPSMRNLARMCQRFALRRRACCTAGHRRDRVFGPAPAGPRTRFKFLWALNNMSPQ